MAAQELFQKLLVFLIFNHSVVAAAEREESRFQNFVIDLQKMRDEHNAEVEEMKNVIKEQNRIIQNLTEIIGEFSPNHVGDNVQNAIENFNATINSKIDALKTAFKEINATYTDQNQDLAEAVKTMNERLGAVEEDVMSLETDVIFGVRITSDIHLTPTEVFQYDDVITNIGGGYISDQEGSSEADPNQGKFIAPVAGTYQFSVTMSSFDNTFFTLGIMMEGTGVLCGTRGIRSGETGSCSAVTRMNAGDQVWVAVPDWSHNTTFSAWFNYFSGHLIRRDE